MCHGHPVFNRHSRRVTDPLRVNTYWNRFFSILQETGRRLPLDISQKVVSNRVVGPVPSQSEPVRYTVLVGDFTRDVHIYPTL